ncbi:MAG: PH domain-containing protein [Actinomycetaceae bacterium]|nr:PH domain-containing protein [Actinomycetaceae bacterium]
MSEVETTTWMFMDEIPVPASASEQLLPGEKPLAAYETFRHQALITSKRIIVRDSRDVSGESVEVLSLPFATVLMWSTRSAGLRGFTSQLNLVTLAGDVTIRLGREINVARLDALIAQGVLGAR